MEEAETAPRMKYSPEEILNYRHLENVSIDCPELFALPNSRRSGLSPLGGKLGDSRSTNPRSNSFQWQDQSPSKLVIRRIAADDNMQPPLGFPERLAANSSSAGYLHRSSSLQNRRRRPNKESSYSVPMVNLRIFPPGSRIVRIEPGMPIPKGAIPIPFIIEDNYYRNISTVESSRTQDEAQACKQTKSNIGLESSANTALGLNGVRVQSQSAYGRNGSSSRSPSKVLHRNDSAGPPKDATVPSHIQFQDTRHYEENHDQCGGYTRTRRSNSRSNSPKTFSNQARYSPNRSNSSGSQNEARLGAKQTKRERLVDPRRKLVYNPTSPNKQNPFSQVGFFPLSVEEDMVEKSLGNTGAPVSNMDESDSTSQTTFDSSCEIQIQLPLRY